MADDQGEMDYDPASDMVIFGSRVFLWMGFKGD